MTGVELQECERNISFLNRYCIFEKVQPNNIDVHIRNQIVFDNMSTGFDFNTIDLHQKNIIVQRIGSLYNIVDLINCIEYRYYKNDIQNVELDNIPENIIPVINTMFNDLRIQYQPVFIKDPLNFSEYSESNNQIYFTYHKHIIEKRTETVSDTTEENVEYNNWYIIMYKDQLLFNKPISPPTQPQNEIISQPTQPQNEIISPPTQPQNEIISPPTQPQNGIISTPTPTPPPTLTSPPTQPQDDDIKHQLLQDYNTAKDSNVKLTIKVLKDFLQRVDLKLSGKRDELQQRLETYLMV
jgi:hypothetical protein